MKTRRSRSDSVSEALRVAAAANKPIVPPSNVPLESRDMPFFASVIAEFARADWTAHQLELAAMLARTMCDLESEQVLLRSEGAVAFSEKGTPVVNPRKAVVQMYAGTILAFRRSLALHARAQSGGKSERAGEHLAAAKAIERSVSNSDDELLARPN